MQGGAAELYYSACEGEWSCDLDLRVHDWREAFAALSLLDALSLLSLRGLELLFGPCRLFTSVRRVGPGAFLHTTRVEKLGITLLRSEEPIQLLPEGRRATMRVFMRSPAFASPTDSGPTPVELDEAGEVATYRIPWLGVEMIQVGRRLGPDRVDLEQRTSFLRGHQRLSRVN